MPLFFCSPADLPQEIHPPKHFSKHGNTADYILLLYHITSFIIYLSIGYKQLA